METTIFNDHFLYRFSGIAIIMPRKSDQRTVQTGSIRVQKFRLARSHLCRLGGCEYSGACLDQVRDLRVDCRRCLSAVAEEEPNL